jgi:dipeptidyl aminopeptidase/acylaminoacyl peptidase
MPRLVCTILLLFITWPAVSQETYKKPPKEVLDVMNAPVTPMATVNPTRDMMVLAEPLRYPTIADLSQPMLRLAGMRINPATNGPHRFTYFLSMTLKKIPSGEEIKIALPPNAKPGGPDWSADGKHFVFMNTTATGIELWTGDTTGAVRRVGTFHVNAVLGGGGGGPRGGGGGGAVQWMPDNKTLLVLTVPAMRGKPPAESRVPIGPNVQESTGKATGVATYEDLLKNAHDEALFEYYGTSQPVLVNLATGAATPIGKPAMYATFRPSPDGKYFLVARMHKPFSYVLTSASFPREIEVWDRTGKVVHKVASVPLADSVPIEGVQTGPRNVNWRPTQPSTLIWVEALDEGNPRNKVPFRDKVLALKAPFTGTPAEIFKTEQRFGGITWGANGLALISDNERSRRWTRTFIVNVDNPAEQPREIWSRDTRDRYKDPGSPMMRETPDGERVILQSGDYIFLTGPGSSPQGDRPFLDKFNLKTLQTERLFRCDEDVYESVVAPLNADVTKVLTRRESPTDPPNYFIRTLGSENSMTAFTRFPDPAPQLRKIRKELVKYKRNDGVDLSFTLYLPPDYKEGTRLPTVVWAYPYEYEDAATAGQVSGSTKRFTMISGMSQLFYVLHGYAVLDNAAMPVVGSADKVNDTYVQQITADAQAAIDKAVEMGVTDRDRVGVGGHSYGAFMTANLLAHTRLFRAGVARSGAYNRTLTPFGFQSERRTLWQAPDTYLKMSPFMYADKIKDPLLLIHGEADDNSGTFPIQSDRMYQAIRGNGGKVRLVFLPYEAHGYQAIESLEHTLYEMFTWFDKYVKDAPPRNAAAGGTAK